MQLLGVSTALEAGLDLAVERAAVAAEGIAVVAGFGPAQQTVAAERAAEARRAAAQPAGLDLAGAAAAVAARGIAVVAGLAAFEGAVAADERAVARLTAADVTAFDLAGARAPVAAAAVAVVAGLAGLDHAVAAVVDADAGLAVARETGFDEAVAVATVAVLGVAVVAVLARIERAVAAQRCADAGLASAGIAAVDDAVCTATVAVVGVAVVAGLSALDDAVAALAAAAAVGAVAVVHEIAIAIEPVDLIQQQAELAGRLVVHARRGGVCIGWIAAGKRSGEIRAAAVLTDRVADLDVAGLGDATAAVGLRTSARAETGGGEAERVVDLAAAQAGLLALEELAHAPVLALGQLRGDARLAIRIGPVGNQRGVEVGADRLMREIEHLQSDLEEGGRDRGDAKGGERTGTAIGDLAGGLVDRPLELAMGIRHHAGFDRGQQSTRGEVLDALADDLTLSLRYLANALVEGSNALLVSRRHLGGRRRRKRGAHNRNDGPNGEKPRPLLSHSQRSPRGGSVALLRGECPRKFFRDV